MKTCWLLLSILLLAIITGCSTTSKVTKLGGAASISAEDCEVKIAEKEPPPILPYETLGKIETHVQRNLFFGGRASLDDAYDELRVKACQLGGNLVIINDHIESSASEFSHVHVWATVFKVSQ
jgi:hypothetical protein